MSRPTAAPVLYKLTAAGRKTLGQQRQVWSAFMVAVQKAAGLEYA